MTATATSAHTVHTLTAADLFAISQGAAGLPGHWSATSRCTDHGASYAGLIDPNGDGQEPAFLIVLQADGLRVTRPGGELVADGCASITEALAAVRWAIRVS